MAQKGLVVQAALEHLAVVEVVELALSRNRHVLEDVVQSVFGQNFRQALAMHLLPVHPFIAVLHIVAEQLDDGEPVLARRLALEFAADAVSPTLVTVPTLNSPDVCEEKSEEPLRYVGGLLDRDVHLLLKVT